MVIIFITRQIVSSVKRKNDEYIDVIKPNRKNPEETGKAYWIILRVESRFRGPVAEWRNDEKKKYSIANLSTTATYLGRRVDLDVGDQRHVVRLLLSRGHSDDGHIGGRFIRFCK